MAAVAPPPTTLPHKHSDPSRPTSSTSNKPENGKRESAPNRINIKKEDVRVEARSPPKGQDHGGPHRPPIRPHAAVRSKFDLEVNPFEQSFSRESQHSNSSLSDRATPPRGTDATAIKHNALPPLSSLTSPAAADPSQFPWLANQSLRTGPLSPAMLAGPQAPHGHHANGTPSRTGQTGDANGPDNSFDANAFRTGFTPGAGTGLTPGYSSLIGNNFASSLPMPSPNTAAFLNMVTNSTPLGENNDESNNQPNTHQNNGHPPSAIPPHMQPQHHGLSHIQNNPNVPQDTITPNTLSALTGVMNEMSRQPNGQNNQTYYPQQMNQQQPNNAGHVDYAQQSANAASQAANGLFLLSQAHQELSKREEEDSKSSPASKKGAPKVNGANGAGQKRKSDASLVNGKPNGVGPPAGPPAKKGKRASMPKQESFSPDMDSDIDEDEDKQPLGRPETEEEKRKNFLERNRQAALKCRQRKKAWLSELQTKVEQLTMDNERLQQTIGSLHDEVGRLSSILMQHRDCGLGMPTPYGRPIR